MLSAAEIVNTVASILLLDFVALVINQLNESNMVKALQLRIGNFIYSPYHGKQMQVDEISDKFLVLNDGMKLQIWFDNYEFEGIPLTTQVLEAFGFIRINKASALFVKCSNEADNECFILQSKEDTYHDWIVTYTYGSQKVVLKRTIRYLHELQNMYYNFTGEELLEMESAALRIL